MSSRRSRSSKRNGGGGSADISSLSAGLGMSLEDVQKMMSSAGGDGVPPPQSTRASEAAASSGLWSDFVGGDIKLTEAEEEAEKRLKADKITATGRDYTVPVDTDIVINPGILAQAGTLDASLAGRGPLRKDRLLIDLNQPTILCRQIYNPHKIKFIATSCSSYHSIAVDTHGSAYLWGRNEHAQCGSMNNRVVLYPTRAIGTFGPIVSAGAGKNHSILVDANGHVWGIGRNHLGQLGTGTFGEIERTWKKSVSTGNFAVKKKRGYEAPDPKQIIDHRKFVMAACGEHFTLLLTEAGFLYSSGSSEFGQLGNGETGEHIAKANKISFTNCNKFERRAVFEGPLDESQSYVSIGSEEKLMTLADSAHIRLNRIVCGKNHAMAIEADWNSQFPCNKRVFSWGCGNFGCLGHGVQSDQYYPRQMSFFRNGFFANNSPVNAACGSLHSLVLTKKGHVYYWGRHRALDDATMKPVLVEALANNSHDVTAMACGNQSIFCSTALGANVSWGGGPYGELGYGEKGAKSSIHPNFVEAIDKCVVTQVSAGYGHVLYILRNEDKEDTDAIKKMKKVEREDLDQYEDVISNATLEIGDQNRREIEADKRAKKKSRPSNSF